MGDPRDRRFAIIIAGLSRRGVSAARISGTDDIMVLCEVAGTPTMVRLDCSSFDDRATHSHQSQWIDQAVSRARMQAARQLG